MAHRSVIPFGPQHPVLPEPLHLDLVIEDDRVIEAIPQIGLMKIPAKSRTLPAIAEGLSKAGYKTDFLYGGDKFHLSALPYKPCLKEYR